MSNIERAGFALFEDIHATREQAAAGGDWIRCPKCNAKHEYEPAFVCANDNAAAAAADDDDDDDNNNNNNKRLLPRQVFCAAVTTCPQCLNEIRDSNKSNGIFALPACGHLACQLCVTNNKHTSTLDCKQCVNSVGESTDGESFEKRLSHAARVVQIDGLETCPVCLEEQKKMVALACGHLVCQPDFRNLGGKVGDEALLSSEEVERRRQEQERNLRLRLGTTVTELVESLRSVTNDDDEESAKMALAYLGAAVNCVDGDFDAFLSASGLTAVAAAFARFPRSSGILRFGCRVLGQLTCTEHRPNEVFQRNVREILETAGIVKFLIEALESNETTASCLYLVCCVLKDLFMEKLIPVDTFQQIVAAAVSVIEERHRNDPSIVVSAMNVVAGLTSCLEEHPSQEHDNTVVQLDVPNVLTNAMRRFSDDEQVQERGIATLCHVSFGPTSSLKVCRAGGIAVVCGAMQRFREDWFLQRNGCNFIWSMANCSDKDEEDSVQEELISHEAVQRVRECMQHFPENPRIQEQACSALTNLASKMDRLPVEIARSGCIETIAVALDSFKDLVHGSVSMAASIAIRRLTLSGDTEVHLALMTSNVIPALQAVANLCRDFCMQPPTTSSAINPFRVMALDDTVGGTLALLGVRDISMMVFDEDDEDEKYDFDDEEDEEGCEIADPPFTVTSILSTDLSADSAPGWYRHKPFHVDYERSAELNNKHHASFLLPPKSPQVGSNVCIRVSLPFGGRGYLYGSITMVHAAPTDDEIRASGSRYFEKPCTCGKPDCHLTEGTRAELLSIFGAVHGQEVTANVSLASPFLQRKLRFDPLPRFFLGERSRYETIMRWNDGAHVWEVIRISKAE